MNGYIPVKNQRNIWLYWEHRTGVSIEPPHIRLCRKAIYKHAGDATVHLVTPENLYQYLPDFPRKVDSIRGKDRKPSIALKCDVIRAYLLREYGGLYLDSDTIPLKTIDVVFELFKHHDFVGMQCESFGDRNIPVGVYGSRPQGIIIRQYVNAIRRQMFVRFLFKRRFGWTSLGQSRLTRVVNHKDNRKRCHLWAENLVQPITYHQEEMFLSTEIEPSSVIPDGGLFFTLYHKVFNNELKNITEDDLLYGDMLVSKVLRLSLGI